VSWVHRRWWFPKGGPNITVAKDFLKYSIQPTVLAALLKAGLGRRLPPMKSIVENDKAYWLDPNNEPLAAYTRQGIYGPTIAPYEVFNPARAQVSTEHVFPLAILDVINKGSSLKRRSIPRSSAARRSSPNTRSSKADVIADAGGFDRPRRL